MTRVLILAVVLAVGLVVSGVAGLAGPYWAMLTAGGLIFAGAYLFYDPESKARR